MRLKIFFKTKFKKNNILRKVKFFHNILCKLIFKDILQKKMRSKILLPGICLGHDILKIGQIPSFHGKLVIHLFIF